MKRISRALGLVALVTAMCAPQAVSATTAADAGPVTQPDRLRVASDEFAQIDVLANDSSPSGAELGLCRLPYQGGIQLQSDPVNGEDLLQVFPDGVRPGTYTISYGVCDDRYVSTSTLTLVVTHAERPTATVERPGVVRFVNPTHHRTVIRYGGVRAQHADGRRVLAAGSAATVTTQRRAIVWVATFRSATMTSQSITLVNGVQRPHGGATSRRLVATPSGRGRGVTWRRHGAEAPRQPAAPSRATSASAPPVTAPDRLVVGQNRGAVAGVLANDSDPGDARGSALAVCGVTVPAGSGLEAQPVPTGLSFITFREAAAQGETRASDLPTQVAVYARRGARPGTYAVSYQACNEGYQSPGVLRVRVVRVHPVRAHATHRPGVVRFVNPHPFPVRIEVRAASTSLPMAWYGVVLRPGPSRPLSTFRLDALVRRDVRVAVRTISWTARGRHGLFEGGVVRGIAR